MRTYGTLLIVGLIAVSTSVIAQQKQGIELSQPKPKTPAQPAAPNQPGTDPAEKEEEKPTESEQLLEELTGKLGKIERGRADVRQVVQMLGYEFLAFGKYAFGPEYRMRFDLTVQLTEDTKASLLEVCDGKVRWRIQKILDTEEIEKLEVSRLREILNNPQFDGEARKVLLRQLGFLGPIPMIEGLRETHRFTEHETVELNDATVTKFRGSWRGDRFDGMVLRGQPITLANMPPFLPNETTLWIGENGWLHQIEMKSKEEKGLEQTVIRMEFTNAEFGEAIPEATFAFEPPDESDLIDRTESIVESLELVLEQFERANQNKAKAKKKKDAKDTNKSTSPPETPGTEQNNQPKQP